MKGRVLGIDPGERRVGLAVSDELGLLATPCSVIHRGPALAPVLDELATLVRREGIVRVIVGLPLNEDGTRGRQAKRAQVFANTVGRVLGIPVETWDERLSTVAAETIIRAQGRSTRALRQRGEMDAVAAAVILQDYLDAQQRSEQRISTGTT